MKHLSFAETAGAIAQRAVPALAVLALAAACSGASDEATPSTQPEVTTLPGAEMPDGISDEDIEGLIDMMQRCDPIEAYDTESGCQILIDCDFADEGDVTQVMGTSLPAGGKYSFVELEEDITHAITVSVPPDGSTLHTESISLTYENGYQVDSVNDAVIADLPETTRESDILGRAGSMILQASPWEIEPAGAFVSVSCDPPIDA